MVSSLKPPAEVPSQDVVWRALARAARLACCVAKAPAAAVTLSDASPAGAYAVWQGRDQADPAGVSGGPKAYSVVLPFGPAPGIVWGHLTLYAETPLRLDAQQQERLEDLGGLVVDAVAAGVPAATPPTPGPLDYQRILSAVPVQLVVFDLEGRYQYVSPDAVHDPERRAWMLGRTDAEYFAGHPHNETLGGRRLEVIRRVARRGRGEQFEEAFRLADGTVRHLVREVQPVADADGVCRYVVGYAFDVTERKEAEQQLIMVMEQAEEMNRLKTTFLANMSHEIRTPLTSILGFAEVIIDEAGPAGRPFATLIRESGERLMTTLNAVLDLAQLESRTMLLCPRPLLLEDQVRELMQTLHHHAEAAGVTMTLEADADVRVHLDQGALDRVLFNVLENAVKFTHEGDRISVTVRAEDTHAAVTIRDTGIGIDAAFMAHLFDAFTQESTGMDRDYEGNGLGLTITKRLLDLMGGMIEVESRKGEGSTFILRFPLHRTEAA